MYKSIELASLFRNSGDEFRICHTELLPDIVDGSIQIAEPVIIHQSFDLKIAINE
jgi:hypothetical protein